jgi:putative endonuclease
VIVISRLLNHRRPRAGGDPVQLVGGDPVQLVVPAKAGTPFYEVNPSSLEHVTPLVKQPVVYILASGPYGTLYIGVTSNLAGRIEAHRNGLVDGFTKQYGVHNLVYFEVHEEMYEAIQREKRLKKWNRAWKIRLIEEMNPQWKDLSDQAF